MSALFSTFSPTSATCGLSMIPFMTSVRWYLIVVLICTSLTISNAEHLLCLTTIYMSSLGKKCLFRLSAYLKKNLCVWAVYIFWALSVISFANIFSHLLGFFFCWWYHLLCKSFLSWSFYFYFCFLCLRRQMQKKKCCYSLCQRVLCRFSSRSFMVSRFTFRSSIHFLSSRICCEKMF